jgi:hypothetical protein
MVIFIRLEMYILQVIQVLTKRYDPLAAQSRDDPDPYSFPARIITAFPSIIYLSAASKMSICNEEINKKSIIRRIL